MAGAVSAGSYTAGVFDELMLALERWETAKSRNRALGTAHPEYDHSLPMHEVVIEVISGASAGGINATLGFLALQSGAYKEPSALPLREIWATLSDQDQKDTLASLLDTGDLQKGVSPGSLLNTSAIESLADRFISTVHDCKRPPFIAPDLDLILTATNLRGIDFEIDFSGYSGGRSRHVITHHGGFFRYRAGSELLGYGMPEGDSDLFYRLDLSKEEHLNHLKEATLSTASFPLVFKSREMGIADAFLQRYPQFIYGRGKHIRVNSTGNPFYEFSAIDGGLINNEPYGIALKVLQERNREDEMEERAEDGFAVIMIDPFPSQDGAVSSPGGPLDIFEVGLQMFRALRNQAMFNQEGLLETLSFSERSRFLVAPRRKEANGALARTALASSPLGGFAGFLDRRFREHDYELGRKNCRDFLRYHFTIPLDEVSQRLGFVPGDPMIRRFSPAFPPADPSGLRVFPILPEVYLESAFFAKATNSPEGDSQDLLYPEFPEVQPEVYAASHSDLFRKRLRKLIRAAVPGLLPYYAFRLFYERRTITAMHKLLIAELNKLRS